MYDLAEGSGEVGEAMSIWVTAAGGMEVIEQGHAGDLATDLCSIRTERSGEKEKWKDPYM